MNIDMNEKDSTMKLINALGREYQKSIDNLFIDIYHRVLADRFSLDDVEELAKKHNSDVVSNYYDLLDTLEDEDE